MVFDYGGYNMESIKDFKRKYETLWLFFKGIPQMAIGIGVNKEKQVFVYDTPPYKFRENYRKEFDAILSQAEDYYLSCMVDEIELEDEIIRNIDLIPSIKKSIKDGGYCEYPKVEPRNFPWLKSLLEAQIISNLEFNLACNHIRYCAETMESNVQKLCKLLKRHGNVNAQPKAEEQQQESESNSFTENGNCMTAGDLLLRTFFGNHLTDFLKEARACKDGTAVARLVNWYINEYGLDNGGQYRKKPLHDALLAKGVIKIKQSAWNNAIK